MKIPLVGESYSLRSPAAACQQTLNLIPQLIEDPNETAKNRAVLVGCPGYHLMGDLNALAGVTGDVLKGVWSGGGRCFVVTDNTPALASYLMEVGLNTYVGGNPSTGSVSVIKRWQLPNMITGTIGPIAVPPDGRPALIMGNGNQLGIVKNGYFFISNGGNPIFAQFLLSGTVNTVSNGDGTCNCTLASGDDFLSSSTFLTIDGTNYPVVTYVSPTSLKLGIDAGNQTGALYTTPGGDYVTAVGGAYLDGFFIVQRPIGLYQVLGTIVIAGTTGTWLGGPYFNTGDLVPGGTLTILGNNYVIDTIPSATTLTLVTAPANATYTYAANVGSDLGRQFNISYVNDGTSWDPLDLATKEGYPDHLVSLYADHEQLYLFGAESMEPWQNVGNPLFPFQRLSGAVAREGNAAAYGVVAMNEKVYYLSGNGRGGVVAYRLDGFTPMRISTHAEEGAWASGIDSPSDAIAYSEIHDGHQCWVINFTGALGTWVYDETASGQFGTPIWHQRAGWNGTTTVPYLPRYHTFLQEWGPAGIHVVGDYASGKLYELSLSYFDDNGGDKKWSRALPYLYSGGNRMYGRRMTLEMETGGTSSPSVQPPILRDYSDDRGNTFLNPVEALQGGAGVSGATTQRVFWPANGSWRDRVFRLSGTGQYRVCLIDLDLDVTPGVN